MSQTPPNPYGDPPPPPQYPPPPYPPGQYPTGQYPPGQYPTGSPYAPQTTSGAAIASLILGILGFCIPALSGLVAIILGIVGIRSTAKPNVKGRGLAIAGLVLGVLTLLGWLGLGGAFTAMFVAAAPDRAAGRQFLTDLASGNAAAAQADCVATTTPTAIQQEIDAVKPLGPLNDTTFSGMRFNFKNGGSTAFVAGNAVFGTTPHAVQVTLVPNPAGGKPLVETWSIK